MTEREPDNALSVAKRVVAPRSDLTNSIGTATASRIELVLGEDLLATFGRLLTGKGFEEAATAFNRLRDRLGLTSEQFTDLDGYPTRVGEVIRAAGVAFESDRDLGRTAVDAVQRRLLDHPTTMAGEVQRRGLREVLREAADGYATRYGEAPDPASLEKVAGAYAKAKELYRTTEGSKLTMTDPSKVAAQHNEFERAIFAVESKVRRVGSSNARGLRGPQRDARSALNALAGANSYAQRSH